MPTLASVGSRDKQLANLLIMALLIVFLGKKIILAYLILCLDYRVSKWVWMFRGKKILLMALIRTKSPRNNKILTITIEC